ncbi:epididymal secretory protein 4-like [Sceloporus undulatus]|uniref:epididymal secretory protein 4-like n=1 Tax=Sceloporus undulatus TaxID=8520 RepID=UPI001C4D7941|nr:epididymal secretory protein 4-like [Sceloporus undulatus]
MMGVTLLSLTLAWLCSVGADTNVPVVENLDVQKLAGKWYPIITAKREFMPRPNYAYTIEPSENGDILLKVEIPRFGTCKIQKVVLHTVSPSVFSMDEGLTTIRIVDTDYDTYLIIHFTSEKLVYLNLQGRQKDVLDHVKRKFMAFVEKLEFNPERLFYRHDMDLCTDPPAGN